MKTLKKFLTQLAIIGVLQFEVVVLYDFNSNSWYTTAEGLRYFIDVQYKYNWFQAERECTRLDLQLAVIDSAEKNEDLVQLLKNMFSSSQNLWLGAHDQFNNAADKNRPFYWIPTGEQMTYSNWFGNNPENTEGMEHCLQISELSDNFQWSDNDCNRLKAGFICEENNRTCNNTNIHYNYRK